MKLNNKEAQPFRLWFEYLQTCLRDEDLNKKVDTEFYKEWHLNLVKKLRFDKWLKTHHHLFVNQNKSEIKLYNGKKSPNTLLVEIPIDFTAQRIQKEILKVIKDKVAIRTPTSRFSITSNTTGLKIRPFEYFLYAWKIKRDNQLKNKKITLEEIWNLVQKHIENRYAKLKPWFKEKLEYDKTTGKRNFTPGKFAKRSLSLHHTKTKGFYPKTITMSQNISKAQKILENVCKGAFPGKYTS